MFASLPFILLLIIQGFARQDCAEFLLGHQELANIPVQTRSLKAFDGLLVQLSLVGKDQKKIGNLGPDKTVKAETKGSRLSFEENRTLESGFLAVQRSRDGPVA